MVVNLVVANIQEGESNRFLFSIRERIIMKEPLWMKKMKKHKKTIDHNRTSKLVDRLEKENSMMKVKKVKKKKEGQEKKKEGIRKDDKKRGVG